MATEPRFRSHVSGLIALLLFLATLALFARTTKNEFVAYDDTEYVVENPMIADGLTVGAVRRAFTESRMANWHPLTWLSHALDVELFGLRPAGHHFTSALLHALNAALVFLLIAALTGARGAAFFVAALFAWHPLRVESVAWIAERKDVLSGFFGLLTLLGYRRWTDTKSKRTLLLTLSAFALGLMAKPMLVTLPLVMLLVDVWPLGRAPWLLREKLSFFVLAGATILATILTQSAEGATASLDVLPLATRIENASIAAGTYVVQSIYPAGLACFYPHAASFDEPIAKSALVWAALWIGLIALVLWRRRSAPFVFVGIAWFLITLAPVIGIVQVGIQAHADRYTYLPSIGLGIALVFGLRASTAVRPRARTAAGVVGALALGALSIATWNQIGVWRNTYTLFEHALEVTDRNFVAHRQLARGYRSLGNDDKAIEHFEAELVIHPEPLVAGELAELYFERGLAAQARSDLSAAETAYRAALRYDTNSASASTNLAQVYLATGRAGEAVTAFEFVTFLEPESLEAHFNLGVALERAGERQRALAAFRRVLELDPNLAAARARVEALSRDE